MNKTRFLAISSPILPGFEQYLYPRIDGNYGNIQARCHIICSKYEEKLIFKSSSGGGGGGGGGDGSSGSCSSSCSSGTKTRTRSCAYLSRFILPSAVKIKLPSILCFFITCNKNYYCRP